MSEKEIKQSIRMKFKTQVSYANINNLKPPFWKMFPIMVFNVN